MVDDPLRVACLISALVLLAGHWFPFRKLFRRELPRIPSYIYGVLAIITPAIVLWSARGEQRAAWELFWISVSAGVAVAGAYLLDHLIDWYALYRADREARVLHDKVDR